MKIGVSNVETGSRITNHDTNGPMVVSAAIKAPITAQYIERF
jgi:hypothetical protein